jgi:hypothetical protein
MKGRMKKATGGFNAAAEDLDSKPEARTNAKKIDEEAAERKSGGRAKRKAGGLVPGEKGKCNAGRMPRKSGGRTGSESNPFTGAHKGTPAPGRKIQMNETDG